MAMFNARTLYVALGLGVSFAQIRVMTPEYLVQQIPGGRIEGSTATFGAPFYGDRVLGRLVYGVSKNDHSHCRDDDYDIPKPDVSLRGNSNYEVARLINIVVVKRGKCSFTTKVRIASEKGAHAVIIVDRDDSTLTTKSLANIIVADDGFGQNIHIPSILIAKDEGNRLIQAAQGTSPVVVELAWDVPTNHVVQTDMWMSSASMESLKFLKDFSKRRRALNEVVNFQPHFAVFGMDGSDPAVYQDLCSDTTGHYCAEDPDGAGPITGKDVLLEDVRQLCIHDMYKAPRTSIGGALEQGKTLVEYAAQYWDYMEKFMDRCPLEAATPDARFGQACSERLMKEVGIDVSKVTNCMQSTQSGKLQHEKENTAWSPRALRINGWRYSGILDADLVTRAVCAGFVVVPKECKELISARDPFVSYFEQGLQQSSDGVSFGTLVRSLLGIVAFMFIGLCAYKRYLQKEMRTQIQEEVMLEVQAAYSKMQDGNGSNARF